MRRKLGPLMLMLLMAAGSAHAGDKVDFVYTLGSEAARAIDPLFATQFDVSGEALRVELKRPSYLYLIVESADGRLRLAWPDPRAAREEGASLPRTTLLRLDAKGAAARTWLVVSTAGVPELDKLVRERRADVPAAMAMSLRERYPDVGLLERDVQDHGTAVKLAARGGSPAVVVEEVLR